MTSKVDISSVVDNARYSDNLDTLLEILGALAVIRVEYEADYQGYVDVDILLNDGRIFSYKYSYGTCSGCDEWESRNLNDDQIVLEMLKDASFYKDVRSYIEFLTRKDK